MAKKTSKELFEEWRGKKVVVDGLPAIVVGYDLQFPNRCRVILSVHPTQRSWGPEALDPKEEFIDTTIETPYKEYMSVYENYLKLAE